MPEITYVEHDGTEHVIDVEAGLSLMEGAVLNHVKGIYADCFGDGGCATCHVYIDDPWRSKTGPKSREEVSTLRFALGVNDRSRLSCYIKIHDELDGLVVRMPERQF